MATSDNFHDALDYDYYESDSDMDHSGISGEGTTEVSENCSSAADQTEDEDTESSEDNEASSVKIPIMAG